ncbi:MAG TPA: DeoR/GlpR family DNA-binding transcription regulator [Halanaerobiales bacterium]|nr:DeoR/GlpR family DNA-binding transcription regulator [Halanaerobiales bacterium]
MLAEERRQEILKTLKEKESVHVAELSKILSVTEETIRRDLDILDERKLLKRIHGGAIPVKISNKTELSFDIRRNKNIEEKERIAIKSLKLIDEGDTIFLDASSTSLFLAREIKNLNNVTVITNSVRIVFELSNTNSITVISTGGMLRSNSLSFVGPLANAGLKKYFADKLFASCKGISLEYGATDSSELEIEVKNSMIKQAKRVIIIADHTKINETGLTQFAPIEEIDTIISDDQINRSTKEEFETKGITFL